MPINNIMKGTSISRASDVISLRLLIREALVEMGVEIGPPESGPVDFEIRSIATQLLRASQLIATPIRCLHWVDLCKLISVSK